MQFAIGLYPDFTALDVVGPYQVFAFVPGADVVLCAATPGRVTDDAGLLHIDVEHSFADVGRPDVLLVPGGPGSGREIAGDSAVVDWVRAAHPHTQYTTSVCTGSLVLGAAGLLDGLEATTHWCYTDVLAGFGASPTEQRVVFQDERHVVTGAGVSAGIDLALALVGRMFGDDIARAIQLGIEYDPQPPYDAGAPSKVEEPNQDLVRASIAEKAAQVLA
jgi:transcriptional regulator GlxA family with amidase domain